jgi:hypothetical protein
MNATISLLSALTILASCVNNTHIPAFEVNKDDIEPDTAKPVITTSFKGIAYPEFFEAAFDSSTTASQGKIVVSFYNYEIGMRPSRLAMATVVMPLILDLIKMEKYVGY